VTFKGILKHPKGLSGPHFWDALSQRSPDPLAAFKGP